ncbi:diadenylate cyclase [Desulfococcaceae bacterium HSG9]|nr:diadenylate cyclase [Desulfococcaceae bacterium HSG9]
MMIDSYFSSLRWQDIADIALNSYILFRLFVLFRGTNVLRIITGMAIIWLMQWIAAAIGLIITIWVLQALTAVTALIIIIVFRNEIRRVLQTKNIRALLWDIPRPTVSTTVGIVAETAFELAQKRIGALMIFPVREDLSNAIHSGIAWDGLVSREMLLNIFWKSAPVHDGACVIHGKRVTQVGCILPLSLQKKLPSHYGTRHRAALGLSEQTDALVVVISEERGAVLVANHGTISRIRNETELVRLMDKRGGLQKKSVFFKKERWQLTLAAIVSVLLITGIWFNFTGGLDTIKTIEAPIEYMDRNPELEILNTSVVAVKLQLSGSDTLIKALQPDSVGVRLDLSEALEGANSFTLTEQNIKLPPGIVLKKMEPSVVEVMLDIIVTKELPIQVDWVGQMPPGLILKEATTKPQKIRVKGGKQVLKSILTLYTEQVSLNNISKSGKLTATLAINPALLAPVSPSENKVTVIYTVAKRK